MGTISYDEVAAEIYRDDPKLAAEILNDCLLEGEQEEFLIALRHMSKAFGGMQELAKTTGLHEKTLYKTLSEKGNPSLKTLLSLIDVMGLQLNITPKNVHNADI